MTVAPARFRGAVGAARWWPWLRLLAVLAILVALVSLLGTKAFVAGLHVLTPGAMLAALGIGLATTRAATRCAGGWSRSGSGCGCRSATRSPRPTARRS